MTKENFHILGFSVLIALLVTFAIFIFSSGGSLDNMNDIQFCQAILKGLIAGKESLIKYIDWSHFKAIGADVGASYNAAKTIEAKDEFGRQFIRNFAYGFKKGGGSYGAFTFWRIKNKDSAATVVAVDYKAKAKVLLFTLSGGKDRKLTSIQWEGVGG